ncbi:hypothetical protein ICE98_01131 [Lactococcus lactis]|nr:hypothetical protein [Lactococcus lactis]
MARRAIQVRQLQQHWQLSQAANPTVSATQASNNYTVTLTAAAQTATFNYGYINTAQHTPAVPSSMTTTGGTTGANVAQSLPTGWNTPSNTVIAANKIPYGYYISAIYAGNLQQEHR